MEHTCQGSKSPEMYGIIAGVIIFVVLIICVCAVYRRKKSSDKDATDTAEYKPGHVTHYSTDHHSDHSRKSSASSMESGGAGGGF